jgi:uncharacterized protein (UPF0332 family)
MIQEDKDNLIRHRIGKSHEALADALFSIENNRITLALNRLYYSMFYIVSALSLLYDFSTSKHKQLLGWFNKSFIHSGLLDKRLFKIYSLALDNRQESDYEDFSEFSNEDIQEYYQDTLFFINSIEKFIIERIKYST